MYTQHPLRGPRCHLKSLLVELTEIGEGRRMTVDRRTCKETREQLMIPLEAWQITKMIGLTTDSGVTRPIS